jgi:hypothetical protein
MRICLNPREVLKMYVLKSKQLRLEQVEYNKLEIFRRKHSLLRKSNLFQKLLLKTAHLLDKKDLKLLLIRDQVIFC